ncbi:MAG: GNAT family N-acetyltransferase [Akkermansiaceae bacterium]|nr:GNAT family N-acetyltransferase [Akkermansiaceae bacterium]
MAMHDMLVRLYDLPDVSALKARCETAGISIRRCGTYERHIAAKWIEKTFSAKWVSEFKISMSRQPAACIIATKAGRVIGFACYDVTARGFLGPMGVDPSCRESGIGCALLVTALECLHAQGYAYAVIGGVGPAEFYRKCVGATPIEGSVPGVYRDILPEL